MAVSQALPRAGRCELVEDGASTILKFTAKAETGGKIARQQPSNRNTAKKRQNSSSVIEVEM